MNRKEVTQSVKVPIVTELEGESIIEVSEADLLEMPKDGEIPDQLFYQYGEVNDLMYVNETGKISPDREGERCSASTQNVPGSPGTQSALQRLFKKLGLKP